MNVETLFDAAAEVDPVAPLTGLGVRHCPRFQTKPFVVAIFNCDTAVRFGGGDPYQLFFQKLSF